MSTEIKSKSELAGMAVDLNTKKVDLSKLINDLKKNLENVSDYDDINVSSAANILINNLDNVYYDIDVVSQNIKNYIEAITEFDVDDFSGSDIESYLDSITGSSVALPDGLGKVHTYMGWQCITAKTSTQYQLREAAGMNFDAEGFGKIGDRYVVATTTTFGKVGDYIDVYQEDGSVIKCIIGDIKNQADAGCNEWGHNNGTCVVEFVVDKSSWYGTNKSPNGLHPEWNQNITQIVNKGNYFELGSNIDTKSTSVTQNTTQVASSNNSSSTWSSMVAASAVATKGITASHKTYSHNTTYTYNVGSSSNTNVSKITTTEVKISSGDPNIDLSKYRNNIPMGFEVSAGNLAYELSEEDIELLIAIVAAESDKTYDDALAVITTILNRCESPNWIRSHGTDPIAQATAPNQFVVYQHGSYKTYMNGNAPETVVTAVKDALAGVRNHDYLSFRSNGSTSYSDNMISPTGNRYK